MNDVPDQPWVVATLDGYCWWFPQAEVLALESLLDLDPDVRTACSPGALALAGAWWPVYSLSGELQWLATLPETRRVGVVLDNGADRFVLASDRVDRFQSAVMESPLPVCMTLPNSPIRALIRMADGRLGYGTDTERVAAWLAAQLENVHG